MCWLCHILAVYLGQVISQSVSQPLQSRQEDQSSPFLKGLVTEIGCAKHIAQNPARRVFGEVTTDRAARNENNERDH